MGRTGYFSPSIKGAINCLSIFESSPAALLGLSSEKKGLFPFWWVLQREGSWLGPALTLGRCPRPSEAADEDRPSSPLPYGSGVTRGDD